MERVPGKIFFWSGVYSQDMNKRETLVTDLNVFAGFDPKLFETGGRGNPRMGPKTLIIKKGEHGALLFHGDAVFSAPGYLLDKLHDPTGAGDCFAGG
ncbi:MAG: hypothetical protein JJE04_06290, partial [Acidobacteriia bacterium]|nr:hypothetical protein [Terriglobia bacterium]